MVAYCRQRHAMLPAVLPGVDFHRLFKLCRDQFLVSVEANLKAHLTEFRDHQLLQTRFDDRGFVLPYLPDAGWQAIINDRWLHAGAERTAMISSTCHCRLRRCRACCERLQIEVGSSEWVRCQVQGDRDMREVERCNRLKFSCNLG